MYDESVKELHCTQIYITVYCNTRISKDSIIDAGNLFTSANNATHVKGNY